MNRDWRSTVSHAVASGWCVAALELSFVVTVANSQFAGIWEIQYGTLWLLPALALVTAALSLLGLVVTEQVLASRMRLRVGGVVLAALLIMGAAYSVTTGRHFELWWRRAGFIGLLGVVGAGALWGLGPTVARLRHGKPAQLALSLSLTLIGCELCNRFLLVRLYPGFHSSLTVAVLLLAPLWGDAVLRAAFRKQSAVIEKRGALPGSVVGVLATLSGVTLTPAAERLSRFDNFRWVLAENGPIAGLAVRLNSVLSPPPELDGPALVPGPVAHEHGVQGPRWPGANVLLITVDALRADHLGAYGYPRQTTPHLDELAETGIRFSHAYCPTPHTSYSVTSLMTGKYIRPLLMQGIGQGSEPLALQLRRYGYRTAGFYPPAVFFIDRERFQEFQRGGLGFEYRKEEFLEGAPRVAQVAEYLDQADPASPTFIWVHLFGPHEPYVQQSGFEFGTRDLDRYDSEIAAADATVGELVSLVRGRRPDTLVVLSSDHGEEFGEHGGRYHGSSVYEEQVRVPLIINYPGKLEPRVVAGPVQTIDVLPTLLSTLDIPIRPNVRGRDLGPSLVSGSLPDAGLAFAETDTQTLLAEGTLRLVCERQVGACKLFDLQSDPTEHTDVSQSEHEAFQRLRLETQRLNASHGRFERDGQRPRGQVWPAAVLRAMAGDGDAAGELAELLDDADVAIRRKSAELLFDLGTQEHAPALRLALHRDEDEDVRRWAAVALTRLGEGAALTAELVDDSDVEWRRRAALAQCEGGDGRARHQLIEWWMSDEPLEFAHRVRLLRALGKVRAKEAVSPLLRFIDDVRLRPELARALGEIGDDSARGLLAKALKNEVYHSTAGALLAALERLDAREELVSPLRRWLATPDPLESALPVASRVGILEYVGGPSAQDLRRLRDNAEVGELVRVVIPPASQNTEVPLRLLIEASNRASEGGKILVGLPHHVFSYDSQGHQVKTTTVPEIHPRHRISIQLPTAESGGQGGGPQVRWTELPVEWGLRPGSAVHLVVFAERGVEVRALAVVPLWRLEPELQNPAN